MHQNRKSKRTNNTKKNVVVDDVVRKSRKKLKRRHDMLPTRREITRRAERAPRPLERECNAATLLNHPAAHGARVVRLGPASHTLLMERVTTRRLVHTSGQRLITNGALALHVFFELIWCRSLGV